MHIVVYNANYIFEVYFKSEKQQWILEWTDTQTYTWMKYKIRNEIL